jgi:nitrite reductase/ring-hydroxylating ferredoxin subunit
VSDPPGSVVRMGPVTAQLLDELGYDPDDGVPDLAEVACGGRAERLRIGSVIAARIGARRVAVARLGSGRLVVVDDVCPHDGGRISDGFVDGELLVCARHGWELAARNGRCERACKLRE